MGKYMYMMDKNRRMVGRNIKIVDKGNMVGKDINMLDMNRIGWWVKALIARTTKEAWRVEIYK